MALHLRRRRLGFAAYDDINLTMHVVQHLFLMRSDTAARARRR